MSSTLVFFSPCMEPEVHRGQPLCLADHCNRVGPLAWTSLARGCDLGMPYERYVWRVHVRGVYPGEVTLRGASPWGGGAIEAWGVGYPHLRKCLCLVP
jgi:hypothetical protein